MILVYSDVVADIMTCKFKVNMVEIVFLFYFYSNCVRH